MKGFNGCLDYIWAYPSIKVEGVAPMANEELLKKYKAIPSKIAPSDHLPLICDINLLLFNKF